MGNATAPLWGMGTWYIASVSWGKDSLAMLLNLIELGEPLN